MPARQTIAARCCAKAAKAPVRGLGRRIRSSWPQNKAEIVEKQVIGDYVLFREHVTRGPATDGPELVEPFDVIAVYSFEQGKCSRVEFIR
jgi:hypothetical protein